MRSVKIEETASRELSASHDYIICRTGQVAQISSAASVHGCAATSGGGSKASVTLSGLLTCYFNLYTGLKWVRDVEIRASGRGDFKARRTR